MVRHLLTLADLTAAQIRGLIAQAEAIKAGPSRYVRALYERTLLMIFEAPSLRTRLSFETAMTQLHGHAINYYTLHSPWGAGKESIEDFARTVSRYCDAVTARVFSHDDLRRFAAAASVPVINAMTNEGHPCQILGDLLTLDERLGHIDGFRMAYAGDARNNVTYSLMRAAVRLGFGLKIACPRLDEYCPAPDVLAELETLRESDGRVEVLHDLAAAVADADVVYTDSWMSYRVPETEKARRQHELAPYRVDSAAMARADADAVFMHCLPAMRGMEVTADVIDGPQSIVFDQAENRMHIEKAILLDLIEPAAP
jgi:ornithine carbamoyltransferase